MPKNILPVIIKNQANLSSDTEVYVSIKGLNEKGEQCFIKFDSNGRGVAEAVNLNSQSTDYAFKLSDLPNQEDGVHVELPYLSSGRMYFSVGEKINFHIEQDINKQIVILDPDGFKTRDENYYKLYDKIEFSNVGGGTWINPTAVDFFSLPITIEQNSSVTPTKKAGISKSFQEVLSDIEKEFQQSSRAEEYEKLILKYKGYTTDGDLVQEQPLRIMAPGKAMIGSHMNTNPVFDKHFLADQKFNYIDFLWNYYAKEGNFLHIDCNELRGDQEFHQKLSSYVMKGHVVNDKFVFTNAENEVTVEIGKPETISFFAGSIGNFDFPNHTVGAILVREITAAFDVGLLPVKNDEVLSKQFFIDNHDKFYTHNDLIPDDHDWYDVYSKALHQYGKENPIYTFAYDDALGQDGTLHDPNVDNLGEVVITINDLNGIKIPDFRKDDHTYKVHINKGFTPQGQSYELKIDGHVVNSPSIDIDDVKGHLDIELDHQKYTIYFDHLFVEAGSNAPLSDGIVIECSGEMVNINLPGPPC